jgi:hypothetical protein
MAAPVCGTDGLTYWNECLAKLANVQVKSKGYCEGGWPAHAQGLWGCAGPSTPATVTSRQLLQPVCSEPQGPG